MHGKDIWVDASAMRKQHMSYQEIAHALGINKRTAIKLCNQKEIPAAASRERPSMLDPFKEIINAWLERRPKMNATVVYDQLQPLGYEGGGVSRNRMTTSDFLRTLQRPPPGRGPAPALGIGPLGLRPFSPPANAPRRCRVSMST